MWKVEPRGPWNYVRLQYGKTAPAVFLTRVANPFQDAEVWNPDTDEWEWANNSLTDDTIELCPGKIKLGTDEAATEEVKQEVRDMCKRDNVMLAEGGALVPRDTDS